MQVDSGPKHAHILALPLLARGAASAGIAAYVLRGHSDWSVIIHAAAWYALIDGALGLITGALIVGRHVAPHFPLLTALTFCDALLRVAVGAGLLALPTVAEIPMSVVPLFGAVGLTSAALGLVALVVWLIAHHRYHRLHRRGLAILFDPLVTIGFLSIAVGTLLFIDPPSSSLELRDGIGIGGIVLAASYAVSAVGAVISESRSTGGRGQGASFVDLT